MLIELADYAGVGPVLGMAKPPLDHCSLWAGVGDEATRSALLLPRVREGQHQPKRWSVAGNPTEIPVRAAPDVRHALVPGLEQFHADP